MNGNFQWPPLESDPQIFTDYSQKAGLDSTVNFGEIYSLDYKEMQVIETPVLAVIVSYEQNQQPQLNNEQFESANYVPFYMKQTGVLDNACGLIAMIHSIGNNVDKVNLSDNSILQKFLSRNQNKSAEERAQDLENFQEFQEVHHEFAEQGQSEHCEEQCDVKNHFVAFIYHQGNLVELDGLIQGPYIVKEKIKETELLDETIEELRKRFMNGTISENLALMYLTKN